MIRATNPAPQTLPPATGPVAQPGRNEAFAQGHSGGPQTVTPFRATSVLDAMQIPGFHPADGNSAADQARQTPSGEIPSANGTAPSTYNAQNSSAFKTRLGP